MARQLLYYENTVPVSSSRHPDGDRLTLCLDEEYAGWNQHGRGQRLFDAEGERTEYLEKMLGFAQGFHRHFERTQAFCQTLKELDLLQLIYAHLGSLGNVGTMLQRFGLEAASTAFTHDPPAG